MKAEIREKTINLKDPRVKYEGGTKILTVVIQEEIKRNTLFVR